MLSSINDEIQTGAEDSKYYTPEELLIKFQDLFSITDEALVRLIQDNLNSDLSSLSKARDLLKGLEAYFTYQKDSKALIKLVWA